MDNEDTFVIVTVVTVMGGVAVQGEKKKKERPKEARKEPYEKEVLGVFGAVRSTQV